MQLRSISFFSLLFTFLIISCNRDTKYSDSPPRDVPVIDTVQTQKVKAQFDSFGFRTDTLMVNDYTVQRNESFYLILDKFNFSPQEIYNITHKAQEIIDVSYLQPGQPYRTYASSEGGGEISRLVWQPNPVDYIVFEWQDSLNIYASSKSITTKEETAFAVINSSLYEAVLEKDLSPILAYKLSEIYAWEIDFFRLRKGDRFRIVYEEKYIDGKEYSIGDILAVEFNHRGELYAAYKFGNDNIQGYFDEAGNSVQKALLKTPFKYDQRISSGFSYSRFHPVLHRRTPHLGVDYAAPYGTPVLAVGDGTIIEAQYRGANGNIIKIRHNATYKTAYLHLKGFAGGIQPGVTVQQGQIIGYVGNTGRVTGTHLDYRVYINDRPVNPVTLDLPASESISKQDMKMFKQVRDRLDKKLEQIASPELMVSSG